MYIRILLLLDKQGVSWSDGDMSVLSSRTKQVLSCFQYLTVSVDWKVWIDHSFSPIYLQALLFYVLNIQLMFKVHILILFHLLLILFECSSEAQLKYLSLNQTHKKFPSDIMHAFKAKGVEDTIEIKKV